MCVCPFLAPRTRRESSKQLWGDLIGPAVVALNVVKKPRRSANPHIIPNTGFWINGGETTIEIYSRSSALRWNY